MAVSRAMDGGARQPRHCTWNRSGRIWTFRRGAWTGSGPASRARVLRTPRCRVSARIARPPESTLLLGHDPQRHGPRRARRTDTRDRPARVRAIERRVVPAVPHGRGNRRLVRAPRALAALPHVIVVGGRLRPFSPSVSCSWSPRRR